MEGLYVAVRKLLQFNKVHGKMIGQPPAGYVVADRVRIVLACFRQMVKLRQNDGHRRLQRVVAVAPLHLAAVHFRPIE